MKIKVKVLRPECKIERSKKGEWIDLHSAEDVDVYRPKTTDVTDVLEPEEVTFYHVMIDLGIAMELPKYFEAIIAPRSSTFKSFGIIQANSVGVIDSSYCGDNDIWKFPAISLRESRIKVGDRIAQFRIRPGQFAPWWVKLKWLFTSKIEFEYVSHLGNSDRGGFGSTGK